MSRTRRSRRRKARNIALRPGERELERLLRRFKAALKALERGR